MKTNGQNCTLETMSEVKTWPGSIGQGSKPLASVDLRLSITKRVQYEYFLHDAQHINNKPTIFYTAMRNRVNFFRLLGYYDQLMVQNLHIARIVNRFH